MEAKDVIYALGILLTFALCFRNFIANYRGTRRTSFINTVTSQRAMPRNFAIQTAAIPGGGEVLK